MSDNTVTKVKGKPGAKINASSAMQRAKIIYDKMAGEPPKTVIAQFVSNGIPKTTANTYFHLIKRTSGE